MARKPRLHVEGGFYHVILRGNGGDAIFFSDADRSRMFLLIQEGIERFRYRLHAYCFMTNHVHLLIQVGSIPLSRIIQNLSFRYTRYVNKRKKRIGHLFQGRYKAILINADSYLLELVRYIHNNPVRAGMVENAANYKASSHLVYLGDQKLPFLTTDLVLGLFAKTAAVARRKFSEFVEQGEGEGHRKDFYSGEYDSRVLGDDSFVEKILSERITLKKPSLDKIVECVCDHCEVTEKDLRSLLRQRKIAEIRGIIGWLVMHLEAATLSEVAERFNRDVTSISRAVGNIENSLIQSNSLKKQIDKLQQELLNNATTQA